MNTLSILSLIFLFLTNIHMSFCMQPKRTPVVANNKQITKKRAQRRKELNEREIAAIIASLDDIKVSKKNK